jgi:hypothetical protein
MKTFIVLILSCASVLGDDTGIQSVTTVKTNAEVTCLQTVFTRDGQTNLVRSTVTTRAGMVLCSHRFYHAGTFIGDYEATPLYYTFNTEAGSPYSTSFVLSPSKDVQSVVIVTNRGVLNGGALIIDEFTFTNGIFSPVKDSDLNPSFSPVSEKHKEK